MMPFFIDFEPIGRRGECPANSTLLDCARQLGVDLVNLCGGNGSCGRCVVRVMDGQVSDPREIEYDFLTEQEIQTGHRLACQCIPIGDCKIYVPPESLTTPQRAQVEGDEIPVTPEPMVQCYPLELTPPSFKDLLADAERVIRALEEQYQLSGLRFCLPVLEDLSPTLREMDWKISVVVRESEVIALLPHDTHPLGLAVDIGTTKIAAYLVDLSSGKTLASEGIMNPQVAYGEDVLTRMVYAQKSADQAAQIQQLTMDALNRIVLDLCSQACVQPLEIVDAVLVGNTAIHHLSLGLPVRQLGRAPYIPSTVSALDLRASELGLTISPGANLHFLPNIAGYVGADHVAMLLATDVMQADGVVLAIDVGTNTEICLVDHGSLSSLSTASGPAFEGAHIQHGMRAANGAIERLRFLDDHIEYQTIGGSPPVGLCGSGILDTLAELYKSGIVNRRGRLGEHTRVRKNGNLSAFVIVERNEEKAIENEITFSQKDIQELQLAKGAIRTGINMLLQTNGLTPDEINQVIIAGAFGTYLDVSSAITIGMLPPLPLERVRQVGNAAGMGAKLALISKTKREEAKMIARRVQYIELAANPKFSKIFAKALFLG